MVLIEEAVPLGKGMHAECMAMVTKSAQQVGCSADRDGGVYKAVSNGERDVLLTSDKDGALYTWVKEMHTLRYDLILVFQL